MSISSRPSWLPMRVASVLRHVRFGAKYRLLTQAGTSIRSDAGGFLRFLFLNNELHTFSYRIRNEESLANTLADALGVDPSRVAELFDEGRTLVTAKWKRPPHRFGEPTGQRLAWYAITRIRRPAVVIESGVDRGLGSVVLLTALEANRREGCEGVLISIDPTVGAGFLVPSGLRDHWTIVRSGSCGAIPEVLVAKQVNVYFHDSLESLGEEELREALARAAPDFIFFTCFDSPAMQGHLERSGARTVRFVEEAIHPVYRGRHILIGFFDRTGRA